VNEEASRPQTADVITEVLEAEVAGCVGSMGKAV
jgi:hypothetical protein